MKSTRNLFFTLSATVSATVSALPSPASAQDKAVFPEADAEAVPSELFVVPEGLEVTLWAGSPDLYNPTNMDLSLIHI